MATRAKPPLNQVLTGTVRHWDDGKGYGFIQYTKNAPAIFFHISSFAYHHRRPQKGDKVTFIITEEKGRYKAQRVVLEEDRKHIHADNIIDSGRIQPYITEACIFALIDMLFYIALTYISFPLAIASIIISCLTYILYSLDKSASLQNKQRIPEASLHIATMLGGWPGALIARALLCHKTKKIRFIIFFWLSIIIYFAALYGIVLFIPEHLKTFNLFFMSALGF